MGMQEKDLVEKLETELKKQFNTSIAVKEFSAGYGIADLVLVSDSRKSKRNIGTPITRFNALQVFLNIEAGICTINQLLTEMPGFNERTIKKELNYLIKGGYIERRGADRYSATTGSVSKRLNKGKKIIAIEAKLTDYRGGLVQARRYQYFADTSYLALLKKAEHLLDYSEFSKYGVGLILFDELSGDVEVKHPTVANDRQQQVYRLFAGEMLSKHIYASAL